MCQAKDKSSACEEDVAARLQMALFVGQQGGGEVHTYRGPERSV